MKLKAICLAALTGLIILAGCSHKDTTWNISPDAGTSYKAGDVVAVKATNASGTNADSVVYLIDSVRFTSRKDTLAIKIKTDTMPLGSKLITARIFADGKAQEVSTNIILKAAKAPVAYGYKVVKVFPHDTSSYTEGLEYHDGYLYESAGDYGHSSLRKVDLNTGKVVKIANMAPQYFGEGIATVGNKILQLTYREKVAFIYDKNTFQKLDSIPYNWAPEGWGMCFDGTRILHDDSSNRIWFLNKDTFKPQGYIDVYDDQHDIQSINELEYIDGKIFANIYQTDTIIAIDPKTGAVLERIDLSALYPQANRAPNADVLNGIAWDAQGHRLFITGKKWPKLYQVVFSKL